MRRIAGAIVALVIVAVVIAMALPRGPAAVYTVAALRSDVASRPAAWLGQAVLVRGVAIGIYGPNCAPGAWCAFGLVDPDVPISDATILQLQPGAANPLLATLRRAPALDRFIPAPQRLYWGQVAVYHLQIEPAPAAGCATRPCYRVVLPDAPAPGPHGVFVSTRPLNLPHAP